jgi:hypothetical protein
LWASLIFVVGAVVSGLVLKWGNLAKLAGSDQPVAVDQT